MSRCASIRLPREAIKRRAVLGLMLVGGIATPMACSRNEPERAPGRQTASPSAMPASPQRQSAEPAALPTSRGDELPASVGSFLEPLGVPMTADMAIAAQWLEALRKRDKAALSQSTSYPFEWLDAEQQACTAQQPAATPDGFLLIVDCMLADVALLRALNEHDRAGITALPIDHLQSWAQPWRERAPANATLVNAFIKRSDIQVDANLWISGGAVRGLWTQVLDGTSAVGVARRWLDALRDRDIGALARATSYPFEVRDTGREAACGRRSAGNPKALESAVRCLLSNDALHRALANRAPFVENTGPSYSIPNWAERWWQGREHSGLTKISGGASDPQGFSFDLLLLIAPDGVRAVWQLGSLESRD